MRSLLISTLVLAVACRPATVSGPIIDDTADTDVANADDNDNDGYSPADGDCNDDNAAINPEATDVVGDGGDQNCDGVDGIDGDQDGVASEASGGNDCDDADAERFPGNHEVPYDGIDQDCTNSDLVDVDGDGVPYPTDCDDNDFTVQDNPVEAVFPADGANDAYYRTSVEAELDSQDATAVVTLQDGAGGAVAGQSWVDGKVAGFTPTDALQPSSSYTASLSSACTSATWSFTTSEVGGATTTSVIEGEVYEIDLASGRIVQPAGVGGLLANYLTNGLLLSVDGVSGNTLTVTTALTEEGANPAQQEVCGPTTTFAGADFSNNPFFELGPQTLDLNIQGVVIPVEDMYVSGAFAPDASYIQGATFKGSLDTRPMVPLVNPGGGDDAVCNLVLILGVACVPCSDGASYCLDLEIDSLDADAVSAMVQRQHLPGETGAAGSSDVCTKPACSGDDVCLP